MTKKLNEVPLSVLDLAPIVSGASVGDALRNSVELVRHVERLGYNRHWVAEHHSLDGVASSATAVLIATLAGATSEIRVGSGGIMLPNHAPLVIAEQFGTLEALHPGRIDLGIGRAPGSDRLTARALRRNNGQTGEDLPQLLAELIGFFTGNFPEDHPFRAITAIPGLGNMPPIWLLGSSGYSAQLAGMLGMPFCFAHHFSAENTVPALELYRSHFRPSEALAEPYAMIGVMVVCGENDEHANDLAAPQGLSYVRRFTGQRGPLPTPEEARSHVYSQAEREAIEARNAHQAVGGPDTVRDRLEALLAETNADELMLATSTYHLADRLASFDRVAALAGLSPRGAELEGAQARSLA
jgi:luciferase family oxidoreductase group 1